MADKFTEVSTLWGNTYMQRYYINGNRVSEAEWRRRFKQYTDLPPKDVPYVLDKKTGTGHYRQDWVLPIPPTKDR